MKRKDKKKVKKEINNRLLYTLITIGILLIIVGGVYAVDTTQAWHNGNQIDFAGIEINPSKVTAPTICIGSDCRTSWPSLPAATIPSCPAGYSQQNNLCFKEILHSSTEYSNWAPQPPLNLDKRQWYHANYFCNLQGTSLCSIAQIEELDPYYNCAEGNKYWTSSMTGVSWGSMTTLVSLATSGGFCSGNVKDWNINSYTIDGETGFFCCKQL